MSICERCAYAEWQRTSNGRLHPSKKGVCTYNVSVPAMPISMGNIAYIRPVVGVIYRNSPKLNYASCPTFLPISKMDKVDAFKTAKADFLDAVDMVFSMRDTREIRALTDLADSACCDFIVAVHKLLEE